MNYLILCLLSFFSSVLLTYFLVKYQKKINIFDRPGERKIHKISVPRTGGIAIFFSIIFAFLIAGLLPGNFIIDKRIYMIMAAGFMIFLLGVYDDIKGANAYIKFSVQIIATLILIKAGFSIDLMTNPFGGSYELGFLSTPLTILWVVGIINAINLIDGLDGLASGIVAIAALFLFIIAIQQNNSIVAILTILIFGANLGFLIFNSYPAKIFMGDCGSMFLGFILAAISIVGNRKGATAIALLIPIVILSIPIVDTLAAIIRRVRNNKNIFQADKQHLHHRLLYLGIPYKKVIIIIYSICVYLGLISILSLYIPKEFMFILLLIVGIGTVIALYILKIVEELLFHKNSKSA